MKHLIKIVSVAAVAALTLSCVSAFAKSDKSKAGQETASTQVTVEEKKAERGRAKRPELTEEEKAAKAEKMKAKLAEKLAEGKITQEEYDAALARIESGDFKPDRRGGRDKADKPELTEEEKAARAEKAKAKLAEKLAEGKITQEEYDEALAKIESGDFKPDRKGGKDKAEKPELTEEEKAARVEKAKAKLAEKLAEGKITQEEYDEALAKIESGDFKPDHRGGNGHSKHKPHDKAADETKENESTVE